MKKFTKVILIAAISLVVVGGIMFGAGCLLGGIKYLKSIEYVKAEYDEEIDSDDISGTLADIYNQYDQGHGIIEKLIGIADKIDSKTSIKSGVKTAKRNDIKLSKTEIKKFDSINIDVKHLDVAFRKSKDDKCYIEYNVQSKDNTNPFSYDIKDNTLYLKESKGYTAKYSIKTGVDGINIDMLGIHIGDNFFSKFNNKNIDNMKNVVRIYIPDDMKMNDINAVMNCGDLLMMSVKAKKFNIELAEGDFITEALECDTAVLNLDEGDIITSNMKCISKADINIFEGDFIVSDIDIKDANITSEEGDIMYSNLSASGNVEIFSEEGDIMGSDCDIIGNLNIETLDGDITVNLGKGCVDKINIYVINDEGDNMIAKHLNCKKSRKDGYRTYTREISESAGSLRIETEEGDIILN